MEYITGEGHLRFISHLITGCLQWQAQSCIISVFGRLRRKTNTGGRKTRGLGRETMFSQLQFHTIFPSTNISCTSPPSPKRLCSLKIGLPTGCEGDYLFIRGLAFHFNIFFYLMQHTPGGNSSYERGGMLVVSLRGVNFVFWSHLGCSGQNAIIFSREGLV